MTTTEPAARITDLDTSHEAATSVRGVENLRSRIFTLLCRYSGGLTHEDIVVAYQGYTVGQGWPTATAQGIRSRVKELEREGRVRREDQPTGRTRSNRRSYRWFAVTDPAEQARLVAAREAAEREAAHQADVERTLVESMAVGLGPTALSFAKASPEVVKQLTEGLSAADRKQLASIVDEEGPENVMLPEPVVDRPASINEQASAVPPEVAQRIIDRYLADVEADAQRKRATEPEPQEAPFDLAMYAEDMAGDIWDGRRRGHTNTPAIARYLIEKGWRR